MPLVTEPLHGQRVHRCATCHGLWIEQSKLGPILWQMPTEPSPPHADATRNKNPACPNCDQPLRTFNYAHDSGVYIKKCDACGGTWLEYGELERLAAYQRGTPAVQQLGLAAANELRASNRWIFARTLLRSRLLSGMIALGYVIVLSYTTGSILVGLATAMALWLPNACIWFPDVLGNLRGLSLGLGRPVITHSTPGDCVAIGGWIVLLSPIVWACIARMM